MNRKTSLRMGTAFPLVLACIGLTDCGGNPTTFPPTAIAVKRCLPGGGLDASFNGSGAVATKIDPSEVEYALAVALQPTGNKIIAAGHSVLAGQGAIALLRYNADGTLDASFGTPGTGIVTKTIGTGSDTVAAALALQPAALLAGVKIIVAGHALTSAKTDIVLLRYNLDGTPDLTFGSGGLVTTPLGADAAALAIQVQPADGKIVAAGSVGKFSDSSMDAVLLRYNNADGALDATFGVGGIVQTGIGTGNNFANALVLQPDRKIVVAGHANVNFSADTSDIALLRYDEFGALETTFGETGQNGKVVTTLGGFDNAFSVALQADLKIVVSGNTGSAGSVVSVAVLRYNADGKLDTGFGSGGLVTTPATGPSNIASGNAVLVQADGSIVVAGYD